MIKPEGVSAGELAAMFDCDESLIRRFVQTGIVVRLGHGRYAAAPSLQNYLRHLRQVAESRKASDASGLNLPDESARLKPAQRQNYELKNARIERETVPIVAIPPAWRCVVAAG